MIYSMNTKNKMIKRVSIIMVITFALGLIAGVGGYALVKYMTGSNETSMKFGDPRSFEEEISIDWSNAEMMGFEPIEIDLDENIQEFTYCLAYGYGIDYPFVLAVMDQESGFDPSTISTTNDYGLFQINEVNHKSLGEKLNITDFLDPYDSARAGLFMLRNLFEKYDDPSKVLMAYNMGEHGASLLWDKGITSTKYSESIMRKTEMYTTMLTEQKEGKYNDQM